VTLALILEAYQFLRGKIRKTPVEYSPELSQRLGVPVWLKLESLQISGSFKLRGAWWRLHRATAEERKAGVATCSAGNHGKALAYAAREEGIPATVFLPKAVDEVKYRAILAMGAEVRKSDFWGFDDTEVWARQVAQKEGMPFISAFDEDDIMAGNGGTLALETAEQLPEVRNWIVPVGGGGLAAGLSYYLSEQESNPGHRIIGCQHAESPALPMSLERGEAVTRLPGIVTVAGGVEGGIGKRTFEVLRHRIHGTALVSEEEIRSATRWMVAQHQYLVEPTAAVTLAACLRGRVGKLTGPTVVLVCGRNVSLKTAMDCF
jgi:threonine dehydratase